MSENKTYRIVGSGLGSSLPVPPGQETRYPLGRYTGKSPSQAAKKAAKRLFKHAGNKTTIKFILKATNDRDSNGNKKTFAYTAKRTTLPKEEQRTVELPDGSSFTNKYKYDVVACTASDL